MGVSYTISGFEVNCSDQAMFLYHSSQSFVILIGRIKFLFMELSNLFIYVFATNQVSIMYGLLVTHYQGTGP